MKLIVHEGNPALPDDVVAARELVHPATMEAEGPLHDLGAISIVNSDSQGMGRIGETVRRTFQLAHVMKTAASTQEDGDGRDDNDRVLRYLAKVTEEPARVHGISDEVGSLAPGRLADLVLWEASSFGVKPVMVFKGGVVAWSAIGEGNASVHGAQPTRYGPDWGATGAAPAAVSTTFVSAAALDAGIARKLGTRRRLVAVRGTRSIRRDDLARNRTVPAIEVSPRGRNRDHGRAGAAERPRRRGPSVAPLPPGVATQSRFRIASAAVSKYSSNADEPGRAAPSHQRRPACGRASDPAHSDRRRTARAACGGEGVRARRRRSWARPSTARGTRSGGGSGTRGPPDTAGGEPDRPPHPRRSARPVLRRTACRRPRRRASSRSARRRSLRAPGRRSAHAGSGDQATTEPPSNDEGRLLGVEVLHPDPGSVPDQSRERERAPVRRPERHRL